MRILASLFVAAANASSGGQHHHHSILTDEQWILYICIVVALVVMAGLMSGLTLGLMSIDVLDMEVRPAHSFLLQPRETTSVKSDPSLPKSAGAMEGSLFFAL